MANCLPYGFVYLDDICPDVSIDMMYACDNNFTGKVVPGYVAPKAILTNEAAYKILGIVKDLRATGYGVLVKDAYRPQDAVNAFKKWKSEPDISHIKKKYYPELTKPDLFSKGFIGGERSTHSRGSTIDLTLTNLSTNKELDMGTAVDFFGKESHTHYPHLPEDIKNNRMILFNTMTKHGFENLKTEWWHYTLLDEPFPNTYYNFAVA